MIPLGKVEKMRIQAFSDPTCATPVGEPYTFQVNPETYNYKYQLEYAQDQAPGTSGTPLKYFRQVPNEWNFDILIDGTGVIKNASALDISLLGSVSPPDVQAEVDTLKSIVLDFNGEVHRNQFLKISWGSRDVFKGTLVSLDLNYKLFKTDGSPLRVVAKLQLREWIDPEQRIREEDASSPDITHERIFGGSDRFAQMTYKLYNDPSWYIDVAAANELNSFRRIAIGTRIKFPPLQ
jgi:hypothetical protein